MADVPLPFDRFGPDLPESPLVLSVPHAGRDYPLSLRAALRVPLAALRPLEDRHVDALADRVRRSEQMIVQRPARAWIDLNRAEDERDPAIDTGIDRRAQPGQSAKLRGGLGLVPRRLAACGELWARPFEGEAIDARILADHRPYHAALADMLAAARARFGIAVLVDIHSMPPVASGAAIVLGDRFGQSAAGRLVHRLEASALARGLLVQINAPYAGGYILARHGAPAAGIHAIQLEVDRARYLDDALDQPGPGMAPMAAALRTMLDALAEEAMQLATPPNRLAAE